MIDFKVAVADVPPLPLLAGLQETEQDLYPTRESLVSAAFRFEAKTGEVVQASQTQQGYRIADRERERIAQLRQDGFSFSRLAPYSHWEEWRPEAQRLWARYHEKCQPSAVTRVAVRYINRIDVPWPPAGKLRDYLSLFPVLPPELPQAVGGFVMRIETQVPHLPDARAIFQFGRVEPPTPQIGSLLLDLDLFSMSTFDVADPALWDLVEALHEAENQYFEACITDITRELFA